MSQDVSYLSELLRCYAVTKVYMFLNSPQDFIVNPADLFFIFLQTLKSDSFFPSGLILDYYPCHPSIKHKRCYKGIEFSKTESYDIHCFKQL